MSDPQEIQRDIERTRAELAETVDALSAKLDVKAQAKQRVHEAGDTAGQAYQHAKAAAPPQLQQAIDKAEQAARPLLEKAAQDKQRTAMIAAGALVFLLVMRRLRRRRAG
ncbi:MAG: DUF3618 domain-containing protein [Jatrophihabitantaceae bacterium]